MANNDQRRRQLAREKFERQQRRRSEARRRAKRRNIVIASTVAAVVVIGGGSTAFAVMGGSGDGKADAAASPSSVPSPSASASAPSEPKMTIDKTASYTMKLKTNRGDVAIAMNAAKTPHTVNSFKYLADKGFFDNTKCHRLTTQGIYVLQCGDPKGDGTGGPGYTIPDENLSSLGKAGADGSVTYKAGTVAMANTGQPHTGGSQFFLVYKDSKLKPSYTPFGTMDSAGLKLVKNVAKDGVEGSTKKQPVTDGAPKDAVTVQKATVDKQ
ncbi:peptidylprolyl isomerase [Streptomyces montanisoli]|uniref:Peptidylprolyl isomerase n=1 Tax=Streptomyces montanisoli TaxID=2798581 RepID=A0A940MCI6_9ACTN|nr:peptidylprolyl isomerase [Streptomyces montanisoli]MBP0458507.1 peptidylprolyl isomerase [Streptomyces montanisoli]